MEQLVQPDPSSTPAWNWIAAPVQTPSQALHRPLGMTRLGMAVDRQIVDEPLPNWYLSLYHWGWRQVTYRSFGGSTVAPN